MIDLDSVSVMKDTLVSTVEISAFVPVVDFLKLELPGVEIVVGSLVDCEVLREHGYDLRFLSISSCISS